MSFLTAKISRNRLEKMVLPYATNKKTLEVGSFGKPAYTKYFPNRTGIDIKEGLGVDVLASVYEMPFPDEHFDVVLCLSVLEHLKTSQKAILEMRRVLKTGGKIIVSTPFLFPIHDAPADFWRFTKFGLKELFSSGWEIEKLCAETDTQETFAVLLQRLGYQAKTKANKLTKLILFTLAKIAEKMPNLVNKMYGDIHKDVEEPEAFASAFFLVAKKI